jgi:hypothetical protein
VSSQPWGTCRGRQILTRVNCRSAARRSRPSAGVQFTRPAPNLGKPPIPRSGREILASRGPLLTTTFHDLQSDPPGRRIPALDWGTAGPGRHPILANLTYREPAGRSWRVRIRSPFVPGVRARAAQARK